MDGAVADGAAGAPRTACAAVGAGADGEGLASDTAVAACPAVVAGGDRARLAQGSAVTAGPACATDPAVADNSAVTAPLVFQVSLS